MLKRLSKWLKGLFKSHRSTKSSIKAPSRPIIADFFPTIGGKDINAIKLTQSQLDKRTHFVPGESYRVGDMTVTVHKDKASMLAAVAAVNAKRAAKEIRLRERGIELMLMSPEELLTVQFTEWVEKRKNKKSIVQSIMGKLSDKRYIAPKEDSPSGDPKKRFKQIMNKVKDKERVN